MSDDDRPRAGTPAPYASQDLPQESKKPSAMGWFRNLIRKNPSNTNYLQEAIEDYIEELKESEQDDTTVENQKTFIVNVMKAHDLRVDDVMVPRADIVAINHDATREDLKELFSHAPYSRIPVYKENLDHVVGVLHIKDLLACLLEDKQECRLENLVREVLIVSPGLPAMELFMTMREDKKHMALVVDEHGGIDGLVTLNDIVEEIVGDIEDEFDTEKQPMILEKPDGSLVADARVEIEDFEERYGNFLNAEEREDIHTLGGLSFELAGRVPKRGETLKHESGLTVEILDANASRVNRVRIRNLPTRVDQDEV